MAVDSDYHHEVHKAAAATTSIRVASYHKVIKILTIVTITVSHVKTTLKNIIKKTEEKNRNKVTTSLSKKTRNHHPSGLNRRNYMKIWPRSEN